jgi:hypothetical protein
MGGLCMALWRGAFEEHAPQSRQCAEDTVSGLLSMSLKYCTILFTFLRSKKHDVTSYQNIIRDSFENCKIVTVLAPLYTCRCYIFDCPARARNCAVDAGKRDEAQAFLCVFVFDGKCGSGGLEEL